MSINIIMWKPTITMEHEKSHHIFTDAVAW